VFDCIVFIIIGSVHAVEVADLLYTDYNVSVAIWIQLYDTIRYDTIERA